MSQERDIHTLHGDDSPVAEFDDGYEPPSEFSEALRRAINVHSKENDSDTPDFIIALFLEYVLSGWNVAVNARERWYGREAGFAPAPSVSEEADSDRGDASDDR